MNLNIPQLAEGGIATKATLAMIGEVVSRGRYPTEASWSRSEELSMNESALAHHL